MITIENRESHFPAANSAETGLSPDLDLSKPAAAELLLGKTALIKGADSIIKRALAVKFCKEGANVAVLYHENAEDTAQIKRLCERQGGKCLLIKSSERSQKNGFDAVQKCLDEYGALNVLVNTAAHQQAAVGCQRISEEQLRSPNRNDLSEYFSVTQAAVKYLRTGDAIVNTCGGRTEALIPVDYKVLKTSVLEFTKTLALDLKEKGIRVNAVIAAPLETQEESIPPAAAMLPPIRATERFGQQNCDTSYFDQPEALLNVCVLLASPDNGLVTGAVIEVSGDKLNRI